MSIIMSHSLWARFSKFSAWILIGLYPSCYWTWGPFWGLNWSRIHFFVSCKLVDLLCSFIFKALRLTIIFFFNVIMRVTLQEDLCHLSSFYISLLLIKKWHSITLVILHWLEESHRFYYQVICETINRELS